MNVRAQTTRTRLPTPGTMGDLERQVYSPTVRAGIAALRKSFGPAIVGVGHSDQGLNIMLNQQMKGTSKREGLVRAVESCWAEATSGTEWAKLPLVLEWRGPARAQ